MLQGIVKISQLGPLLHYDVTRRVRHAIEFNGRVMDNE